MSMVCRNYHKLVYEQFNSFESSHHYIIFETLSLKHTMSQLQNAKADLSLRLLQSFCWFCHEAAHIMIVFHYNDSQSFRMLCHKNLALAPKHTLFIPINALGALQLKKIA